MKIIEVIPITRGIFTESLSYFTSHNIKQGSIIYVPLRKKQIPALVISVSTPSKSKTQIKSLSFKLRKITNLQQKKILSLAFVQSVFETAEYFITHPGRLLDRIIPKTILENFDQIPDQSKQKIEGVFQKFIIQLPPEKRWQHYQKIIQQKASQKENVLIITPTIQSAKNLFQYFQDKNNTFIFHSSLSKKQILKTWLEILATKKPAVIIGTAGILALPKNHIGALIVENENSPYYKQIQRPFLNIIKLAGFFARQIKTDLILGDTILSIQSLWEYKTKQSKNLTPLYWQRTGSAKQKIVDMTTSKKFQIISPELQTLIQQSLETNKKTFLFTTLRGLASNTTCADCGTAVICHKCQSVISLHQSSQSENFFLCHKCGAKRSALEKCINCDSWNLKALGIGIDTVENEIKKIFPHIKFFKVDKDSTKTANQISKTIEEFYQTPDSLLIGTAITLPFLNQIDNTAIISLDALLAVPSFMINERIFKIIADLRSITTNKLLIQTRQIKHPLLETILKGDLKEFYQTEITQRKQFNYPPFGTLIKIKIQGNPFTIKKETEKLKHILSEYNPQIIPIGSNKKGQSVINIILKLSREQWVDRNLFNLLLSLSSHLIVNINPDNLLE